MTSVVAVETRSSSCSLSSFADVEVWQRLTSDHALEATYIMVLRLLHEPSLSGHVNGTRSWKVAMHRCSRSTFCATTSASLRAPNLDERAPAHFLCLAFRVDSVTDRQQAFREESNQYAGSNACLIGLDEHSRQRTATHGGDCQSVGNGPSRRLE